MYCSLVLLTDSTASVLLSSQHIQGLVQAKALEITANQKDKIAVFQASNTALEAVKVDIYSATSEEIIYLGDRVYK